MASWLVRSSPDRAVRVRALSGTLCCVLGQDTSLSEPSIRRLRPHAVCAAVKVEPSTETTRQQFFSLQVTKIKTMLKLLWSLLIVNWRIGK